MVHLSAHPPTAWRWRRLRAHGLLEPLPDAVEAAARSAAPYGALPSGPLALAARVSNFRNADLIAAVEGRQLLRVPAMRGSIYLLPVELAAAGLALARPDKVRSLLARAGLDARTYATLSNRIEAALSGQELTGSELRAAVSGDRELDVPAGEVFTLVLRAMSHEGRIVRGLVRGGFASQIFAYARMADWLGAPLEIPPIDTALRALAPWYLQAHAPATARDFAWWAGVNQRQAQAALESCRAPEREEEPAEWSSVALLPHWDPYLMAHADRSLWLDSAWSASVIAPSGDTTNVLLIDGCVGGIWDVADGMLRYAVFETEPDSALLRLAVGRLEGLFGALELQRVQAPSRLHTIQAPFGR
jgi:Winged helix DNA-binding domain